MKKIYTLLTSLILLSGISKAQLSLTQAVNEPVIGNVDTRKDYDSTSTLPKNTGAGQVWNFTSLATTTTAAVPSTYTTPSAVPGGSNYPAATVAQDNGTFFKSSTNMFEMLGMESNTVSLTFTNSAIIANWPINYNYTNTDPVAGNVSVTGGGSGTFSGSITTTAPGSGTLMLPNSMTFTNCLLVVSRLYINANITTPFPFTATVSLVNFQYYHATQKFPILTITYTDLQSLPLNNSDAIITVNNNVFAGLNELSLENALAIYPNPASGSFHVSLENKNGEAISLEIIDQLGRVIKTKDLGNTTVDAIISTSDLSSGIYFVKTNCGNKSAVKKLIIE
jgi:hypothetical protein